MDGLIRYVMLPTRLRDLREKASDLVRESGDAPIIPFNIGPYEDLEGNSKIGRQRTLRLMVGLKNICDADAFCGVSDGTMFELRDTLDRRDELGIERDVRVYYGLDPEWEKYYEQLKGKYGDLLARLRGRNHLIALVGPRAVGKTFWSDRLLQHFPQSIRRIKNTTTRLPRDQKDFESYHFTSIEDFQSEIAKKSFLEWDEYLGNYYGSSRAAIKSVLRQYSGIFAITPAGVTALQQLRFEVNLKFILMLPLSSDLLKTNFARRGITGEDQQAKLIADAELFVLPPNINYETLTLTGDIEQDEKALLNIIQPLLK